MDPQDSDEDQRCLNLELFVAINYGLKRNDVTEEKIIERVKESLSNGADVNAIDLNNAGNTALHVAVRRHFGQVIQFLLENGAEVDIENSQGFTALTLAQTLKCEQKIIDFLEGYAKSTTNTLCMNYLSDDQAIWNKLRNNSEIAVLEVNSVELSPDFLQQVEFYDAIDTSSNLFFVDVMLSHMDDINEEFIVSQLLRMSKEVIIQCGSVLETEVYCRGSEGLVVVINLNTIVECFDEKILTDKLSGKGGFGLGLLVEALKLYLVGKFETERRSLLKVSFNLEKELECWKLIDFVIRNGDVITARLLSMNPWNLSKLNSSKTSTLTLAAQHGDVEKLAAVLRVNFPIQLDNNIGVSIPKETAAHFDKCKKEMLETAVSAGNCDVISFMIRCGVLLDEDIIQLAWDEKQYDVVLVMLKADCVFPYDFDLDEVDVNDAHFIELRHFIEERDKLHNLIKEGRSNAVKEFLKLIPPSKLYLEKENRSAVYTALKFNHLNVFVWLKSEVKAEFKDVMERKSLGIGVLDSATDALVPHFVSIDNAHILHLVAKSRSHRHYEGFKDHIESIYTELNTIPHISNVMKVIQFCDNVDIIYDFEKDSIVDVNVASSENVTGFCEYKVGRVYIGAKVSQQELLGTVAHELTHLAIQTVYDNDCNPYKVGDPMKEEYDELIKVIRKQSTPVDPIIFRVFSCYCESGWASELIVRVNHMLAYYGSTDGLSRLEVQANSLLEFYTKIVEKRFLNLVSESHLIKPRYLIKVLNDNAGIVCKIDESKTRLKKCIDVREVFGESEVQIAVVTSTSPFLSTMSVHQSLKEITQQPNSFIIFNLEGYLKRKSDINQAFYSDVCKFLVLLCEPSPDKNSLSESLRGLKQVLWKKSDKKVIFIMETCELSNDEVNELVNLSLKVCPDVEYTLDDVGVESAKLLVDQSVSLQCRDANIKLSSLIDEEHYKLVDAQTLLMLINKQPIVIGKQIVTSSNYNEHFYVDRSFNHQAVIKEEILTYKDESTIYAISGIDEETLGHLVKRKDSVCTFTSFNKCHNAKYVIVDSSNGVEQYQQLCSLFPKHNIHWLKNVKGGFLWLESRCIKGDLTELQKLVSDKSANKYSEDKLAIQDEIHRVFIVSDTAGMGKSTILTSLTLRMTKQDLPMWVVRVNLNDYTKVLDEEHEKHSFETHQPSKALYYFVERLLGYRVETKLETEFEKNLLLHLLQHNEDRVVIMFDGFDEIKWSHQQVIKDVLVALKSSKVKQLWVTTRPHMRETLENTLHHLSYTMQPLDQVEQVDFLIRFWSHRFHLCVDSGLASDRSFDAKLRCFAEALIKLLSESISDREKVFTGVPLQLRMVAECFEEDAGNIFKSDDELTLLPSKLKLNDIYQNFFIRKYKIFQSEKNELDSSKPNVEAQDVVLRNHFLDNHRSASLFTLFNERDRELLLSRDEINKGVSFISEISKNTINTGLIDLVIEGKPRFVHLTFAEYLTAEFIVNLLEKGHPNREQMKLMLTKVLYVDEFMVVRAFIDNQLGELRISDAALNRIGSELRYSDGEKSLLHVAAAESNANIANVLLSCVVNSDIKAELIKCVDESKKQALHVAAEYGHLDVVKVLVQHEADVNVPYDHIDEFYDGFSALLLAVHHGRTDVCKWLIKNGANINATVNVEGPLEGYNVLHLAAQYRELDLGKAFKFRDKGNDRKLHKRIQQDCEQLLEFLLTIKEIDVNAASTEGDTPLHLATIDGNSKAVNILLSNGANVNAVGCDGDTPLLLAIEAKSVVVDCLLKTENVDVNLADMCGRAPIHLAACYNNSKVVENLVNKGAIVNVVTWNGGTPLHYAATNGSESVVNYLLNIQDVDINVVDKINQTPLHLAALGDKLKIVEILVTKGANVNAVNCNGLTPLHYAAKHGSESVVKYLLNIKGVDINAVDVEGKTPLDLASMGGHRITVDILAKEIAKSGNGSKLFELQLD